MEDKRNGLWLVEYIHHRDAYRISRFAEPDQTVAYEIDWMYAVKDIVANYGSAVKVILIRKHDGTVDYRIYRRDL